MQSRPALSPVSVSPTSLAAAFRQVPDPRRAASVVSPLPAILALAVAAILANHLSVLAIAEWRARQEATMLAARGFPSARTPCQSTLQRLFRQLDGDALAARLTAGFRPSAVPATTDPRPQGIAMASPATARRSGGGCGVRTRGVRSMP